MRYEIRELDLGGVLDQTVKLTKDNFGRFIGITAVLLIPYDIVQGFVQIAMTPALPPNPTPEQVMAAFGSLSITIPFLFVSLLVVIPITNAALIYCIAGEYLDKPVGVGESLKRAVQRIPALIGTWFLLGLAIMGGYILCIIPGIIAAFWFSLSTQVVVIEGTAGVAALKRSRELMKGNIGTFFVLSLLIGLVSGGIGFGAAFIPQQHLRIIVGSLVQGVATVFASAAVVVFYFSARCKHEQFDLSLLAQSVGIETAAGTAETAAPQG